MTIGSRIKRFRLQRNYTQKYLARSLATSLANYSKMENGIISVSNERLEKIATILEVTLTDLTLPKGTVI
jgi:transcriptional regulator with XRE-family HTH domain